EHAALYEALKAFMQCDNNDELHAELTKSRKRRHNDQDPLPPPPKDSDRSKKKRHDSNVSATKQPPPASPLPVNDDPIPDDMHLSESEDTAPETPEPDWVIPLNGLPKTEHNWADALVKTNKDPEENKLLQKTRDMGSFIKWYCKQIGKSKLVKANLEGQTYKIVIPFHKNNISLQFQMEECHLKLTYQIDLMNPESNRVVHHIRKPLCLGGPPGQVTIQTQYFFNKDMEYIVSGNKERRHALSISKLKAAYYPDFGLEELVLSLWTENILHMRILSVVSLKTFSRYSCTYLKEIVLRRADYKEYKISEANFKNLHPNDFKYMYLLHLQGKLNHLSGADKVTLSITVNLWTRNIVIKQRVEDLQ
ncbi:hypothetical protein Tco_0103639, partial [Tanacetum coccineum]